MLRTTLFPTTYLLLLALTLPRAAWTQPVPVGSELQVNTSTTFAQKHSAVAGDGNGNFIVVWQSDHLGDKGVFGQRFDATGAPAGSEFTVVVTLTGDTSKLPAVAAAPNGDFVVVWQDSDCIFFCGAESTIYGRRFGSTGTPQGSQFQVNTFSSSGYWQITPAVAADSSGNFVVAWTSQCTFCPPGSSQDGSGTGVFAQRYDTAGAPLGGEFQVNTYTTSSQLRPAVAAGPGGNFVVAWWSSDQIDAFDIVAQRFDSSGTAQGSEFVVNTYTTGNQVSANVAMDFSGNLVLVWTGRDGQDGSGDGVFGRRFDSTGTRLGSEFQVNTYTTGNQVASGVTADENGAIVVVWESFEQDGESGGIFGQRYDNTGGPQGDEFQVNSYTTASQQRTVVAAQEGGKFVVVWESYGGQDGSGSAVFAQRFTLCGDGVLDSAETCDDGNVGQLGSCCTPSCTCDNGSDGCGMVCQGGLLTCSDASGTCQCVAAP